MARGDPKAAVRCCPRSGLEQGQDQPPKSSKQKYTREEVNELADYLNIQPYELLMHPDDAMAIRRMQSSAIKMVAEQQRRFKGEPDDVVDLTAERPIR
jgi:hypothetical protein